MHTLLETLLESNVINIAILVVILIRFARQVVGEILVQRQQQVKEALEEASNRLKLAEQQLKTAQEEWSQTQEQINQIEEEANQTAQVVKEYWLKQANEAIAQLKTKTQQSLNQASRQVAKQIRQTLIELAIEKVKQTPIDGSQILDRHISLLSYHEAKNR
jgi:F-type H+-transporting ATPase subunit b